MRLRFERTFRTGLIIFFMLNVVTTATSMAIVEKMIPLHDDEFNRLLDQQDVLLRLLFGPESESPESLKATQQARLVLNDDASWSGEQKPAIFYIRSTLATLGATAADQPEVKRQYRIAIELQKGRIKKKLESFRTMGLAGSWSIGILSLLILFVIYAFQRRMTTAILLPLAEIIHGVQDWVKGNRQRRLRCSRAVPEIYEGVTIINEILDIEAMSRRGK